MARNDMEDRLVAATQTNALFITQGSSSLPQNPRTGHPIDVLDVDAVTAENIGAIIQTGEDAANRWLVASANYTIFDRESGSAVEDCLEDMLRRCEHAMHVPPTVLNLRSNVFMPVGYRLEMRFSARMTGMRDDGLQFPDLATGVTGWCYQTRSPALCNLDSVSDIAGAGSRERRPFNMSIDRQNRIQAGRTWLISYPIFDPGEMQPLRNSPRGWSDVYAPGIHRITSDLIGPIVGIVNVDAGWNYDAIGLDPRPDVHASDPRIITVIDTVAQASLRLARLLVRSVPSE
jgi:hypothetical protein